MSKYILDKEIKKVVNLSYLMLLYLIIFIPFVALDMYHVINASINKAMNLFNTMKMVESAPSVEIEKNIMVKIGVVNLGTLPGAFFQILVLSAMRLKKPYKHRFYIIAKVTSILATLTSITGIILSDSKIELLAYIIIAISSTAFAVLLFNKKVKKWSAELYIPPPII